MHARGLSILFNAVLPAILAPPLLSVSGGVKAVGSRSCIQGTARGVCSNPSNEVDTVDAEAVEVLSSCPGPIFDRSDNKVVVSLYVARRRPVVHA
jgi:hypothetical protein